MNKRNAILTILINIPILNYMIKYWNPERIRRTRERTAKAAVRAAEKAKISREQQRTYMPGDANKNANLMLDALGLPIRRKMVAQLRNGGAMSLSKLVEPFNMTLPAAFVHLRILERAGIIVTHKRGRVRMCVYNKESFKELAAWLAQ